MKKDILTNLNCQIDKNDIVFVLDIPLFLEDEILKKLKVSNAKILYFTPIDYKKESLDFTKLVKYEAGSEEAVSALILNYFATNSNKKVQSFIDELDVGYLSAESNVGEEELEELLEVAIDSKELYLLIGDAFLTHQCSKNIIKILDAINNYTDFNLIINEKFMNKIEQIVSLDEEFYEVQELSSYNGTVIYKNDKIDKNILIGGDSFSKFAKIENGDKIEIFLGENSIKKEFKLDDDLKGTIALCSNIELEDELYNYKQVRITKA